MMRKDGEVVFWQWQRKTGKSWSTIELPCLPGGGYHGKPLHPDGWDQTAGGECWQTTGFHGFIDEDRAREAISLVVKYCQKDSDGKYGEFRLVRCQAAQTVVLQGKTT